jgi:hypothetical protein
MLPQRAGEAGAGEELHDRSEGPQRRGRRCRGGRAAYCAVSLDAAEHEWRQSRWCRRRRRGRAEDGVACVVFAHKSTDGWEALLTGLITGGFVVSASSLSRPANVGDTRQERCGTIGFGFRSGLLPTRWSLRPTSFCLGGPQRSPAREHSVSSLAKRAPVGRHDSLDFPDADRSSCKWLLPHFCRNSDGLRSAKQLILLAHPRGLEPVFPP